MENKYVELVKQMVAKAEAFQEIQSELRDLSAAKDQEATLVEQLEVSEKIGDSVDITLSVDFAGDSDKIIYLAVPGGQISLSVEEFNDINNFLGKYNEVIMRYMNKVEAE